MQGCKIRPPDILLQDHLVLQSCSLVIMFSLWGDKGSVAITAVTMAGIDFSGWYVVGKGDVIDEPLHSLDKISSRVHAHRKRRAMTCV
jgi:hypothetical protein